MALMSGCATRFDASHGSGLPRIESLMPRRPRFDRYRPAAGDLHAAADQRGDIHGAAVDVKQLALEPVLGKEILLLRDPEKASSGVNGRIGNAQLVGGVKLRARITPV